MSQSKKPTLIQSVIGMAFTIIVILVVLFSGASAITQENIKQTLDSFSGYMSRVEPGQGRTGKFTYGEISISGFGFNKTATVSNVSIEVSEKSTIDTNTWSMSTSTLQVLPDPTNPGRLYFVFPSPINIIQNGQLKKTITSSTPIKYGYTQIKKDAGDQFSHALYLPNQVIFTPAKAVGDDSSHVNRTVVSFGDNAKLVEQVMPTHSEREAQLNLTNIKIDSDDGAETTIGSVTAKFSEVAADNNQGQGQASWTISDISGPSKEEKDGKPYSVSGDVNYSGQMPNFDFKTVAPVFSNTDFVVNKLALFNDDFKVLAQGKVTIASDDPLPSGSIDLSIDNAGQFISSYLIPDAARGAVTAAFKKLSGQPVEAQTHLSIPLKREKNGVFYIGDMTFESLTAALAAEALRLPPSVLPPTPAPEQPIVPSAPNQAMPGLPTPIPDQPAAPAAGLPPLEVPSTAAAPATAAPVAPVTPGSDMAPQAAPAVAPVAPAAPAAPAVVPPASDKK